MSSWWLVLLFWNPMAQEFQVAGGWAPLTSPSEEICMTRKDVAIMFLPAIAGDAEFVIDCAYAASMGDAINIVKE